MNLEILISISRIYIYIVSVILLIYSIKTNNNKVLKNNRIASIFYIIFLFISLKIIPSLMGIESGLEVLFYATFEVIDSILLGVVILICSKKLKKISNLDDKNTKFIDNYLKIIIAIPIVIIVLGFLYEYIVLNTCNLFIRCNYQSGYIESTDTQYAIGNKSCKKITISNEYKIGKVKQTEYTWYDVSKDENGKLEITSNEYNDPRLKEIDMDVVKTLFDDTKLYNKERQKYAETIMSESSNYIGHGVTLYKIKNSNYYIVKHMLKGKNGGGIILCEGIYENEKFIDKINIRGDIEEIYLYK